MMFKDLYYGWWVVIACFIMNLYVGGVIFFGFTAFFEPIRQEFGWSYAQISFATSLRGLEMGILAPVVGFFVDQFGSRKLLFIGTITLGFGLILLSATHSLAMFYASFLLIAFGAGGCTSVVTMTAVAHWFQKNVGVALGVMTSGFGAGGLVVPLIVSLIDLYDWRITLILLGFGMWTIGIPLSLLVRDSPKDDHHATGKGGGRNEAPADEIPAEDMEMTFREGVKERTYIYLNVTEAIRMIAVTGVVTHVMPYLNSQGISRAAAAIVASALPLVSIAGRFGFGWLGDRFDKRRVLGGTFLLMSGGVLVFSYAHNVMFLCLFVPLFSLGFGGSMVLRGAILREYFGKTSFGKMLGIIMGSASIGGILGPTLAGYAFDTLGSYIPVWVMFFALTMLGSFLVTRMRPIRKVVPRSSQE
jgi:MFS family permease